MPYTPPVFPTSLPSFADVWPVTDDIDWMNTAHWDAMVKEMIAGLTALGLNPKGAYADVAARLTAIEAAITGIPSGLIAMWSGTLANIPSGWHLCDGVSGRPNLLNKFVIGVATAATNPGATGGAAAHHHDVDNHTHGGGSHVHTQTGAYEAGELGGGDEVAGGNGYSTGSGDATTGGATPATDEVYHIPPYYAVAFIIKD